MPTHSPIARPTADESSGDVPEYVTLVRGEDVMPVLVAQAEDVPRRLGALDEVRALARYAPGKWSVKEVVGHLCDAERIYGYRALRFARNDSTPLPGFEENEYVPAGRFDARSISELLAEWQTVRAATLSLFRGLDSAVLSRRGVANGHVVSVRAMAWLAAGHTQHHLDVLRARYGVA